MSLGETPLANNFFSDARSEKYYPLNLMRCKSCGHVQLEHVVDPKILFSSYSYESGTSASFREHFASYATSISQELSEYDGYKVLDIGCNDGTMIEALKQVGLDAFGLDPAENMVLKCKAKKLDVFHGFCDQSALSGPLKHLVGTIDLITANNVFAHIDDLDEVFQTCAMLLTEQGGIVFEVSYLADVLRKNLFDTVYHEHLDYHHLRSLIPFCSRHGFTVVKVERVPSHGGSIRVWAFKKDGKRASYIDSTLNDMIQEESFLEKEAFVIWEKKLDELRTLLQGELKGFKSKGRRIVAFGAPAKFTTFMHFLGLKDFIDIVVDESKMKYDKYTPGGKFLIQNAQSFSFLDTDLVLISAWNFSDSIVQRFNPKMPTGLVWLVPLPSYSLIEVH